MPDPSPAPRSTVGAREAFAALPLEQPSRSAWPAVANGLPGAPSRPRRWAPWLAVAAGVALVAVSLPHLPQPVGAPAPEHHPQAAGPAVDALVQHSQALEARLQSAPPALRSGSAVLAARWIAADIGAIDVALADATPEHAATLWQARISLLGELDALRRNESIAATGTAGPLRALD